MVLSTARGDADARQQGVRFAFRRGVAIPEELSSAKNSKKRVREPSLLSPALKFRRNANQFCQHQPVPGMRAARPSANRNRVLKRYAKRGCDSGAFDPHQIGLNFLSVGLLC